MAIALLPFNKDWTKHPLPAESARPQETMSAASRGHHA